MLPLVAGQEVFVEARMPGGFMSQVGFGQIVEASVHDVVVDLDVTAPPARPISLAPGSRPETIGAGALEPMQRVRLRLNDDRGSYYADTRVLRVGSRLVVEQPKRLEVEWQRNYFRLDVRLPYQMTLLGLASDGVAKTGTTRDVSGGGVRLVARDGVEIGTRVEIVLQLPHAPVIVHATRVSRPSGQIYSTGPISSRAYERKSMRPLEPPTESNVNACIVQAEARVVRCRMSWTTEEVTHDIGLHFSSINERARDRLIASLLDEQRRRKAMGLDEPRTLSRPPRTG